MDAQARSQPVAVITGGGGDLASGLARELTREGYEVHAPGRTALDVTRAESVAAFFHALPAVDLLVHAAGICRDMPLMKMDEASFADVVATNLTGGVRVARPALKTMSKRRGGHIIFIGSFSALTGPAGQTNYAAAKAGLIGLAESLAREYGGRNIRVNTVLPGFMETKMTAALSAEVRESARAAHCLGRFNTASEVAAFIAFLDRHMAHTSGQVFNLDSRIHRWA